MNCGTKSAARSSARVRLDCFEETSPDFVQPEPWGAEPARSEELEAAIGHAQLVVDEIVSELYGLGTKALRQAPFGSEPQGRRQGRHQGTKEELAKRWISYALGLWLGRWDESARGTVAILSPLDGTLRRDLRRFLADRAGESAGNEIEAAVGGIDRFLAGEFLAWHNRRYRGRPVFWAFRGGGKIVAVSSLAAEAKIMRTAFDAIGQTIPDGWRRWSDDGTAINLAPLAAWIADRNLQAVASELAGELERGRYGFSQTSKWMMRAVSRGSSVECAPVRRRFHRSAARAPHPVGL